jgi:anti-sigma B factor antagonist
MAIEFSASDEQIDATTHVVSVFGEVDIFTAPEFKARISDAIEAGRDLVVVDLAGATFIDSSSLGVLISAHRRLSQRDGRLVIACDVPAVLNTFKITGLDAVLEISASREEALTPTP